MRKLYLLFLILNLSFCLAGENHNPCQNNKPIFKDYFSYENNIYDILCMPYLSAILNNKELVFIKFISIQENACEGIFDEYNWKISKEDLIRYI